MKKFVATIIFTCLLPLNSFAANERVTDVYLCGKDVGILIENVGWVVARESDIGEKRVDRMLSIALTLLTTQMPIGYINPHPEESWCGNVAKPITVLQIKRQ